MGNTPSDQGTRARKQLLKSDRKGQCIWSSFPPKIFFKMVSRMGQMSHRKGDQLSYLLPLSLWHMSSSWPSWAFGSISMRERIKRMMLLMNKDLGPRTQRKVMMNDFSRKKMNLLYGGIKRVMGDMFGMIGRWLIGNYKVICKLTSGQR